jgi:hypothetical protein
MVDVVAPVQVNLRSDDPRLTFVIIRPSPVDSEYDQVVWQMTGSSRAWLPPGQYRLRTVTRASFVERDLTMIDDAELEIVSPSSTARSWGLGTGIAGAIIAGGAAFVLFAAAWGYIAGDCFGPDCRRGLTDRQKVYTGALLGAVAVGGTASALGFRAYFRNRFPRVTVVAPEAKSAPAKTLSFGPARLGDSWGLAGVGTF